MAQSMHTCARIGCQVLTPLKNKYCSLACGAEARHAHHEATTKVPTETLVVKGNTATLSKVIGERVKSLADLVRVCEIDTTEWDVVSYECNKWEMGAVLRSKVANDAITVTELFQVKAKLKRRLDLLTVRDEIARMKDDAKQSCYDTMLPIVTPHESAGPYLLQVAIPDVHMGKLAWKPETGANYDLNIAEAIFEEALDKLIERTQYYHFAKVLFVVGSDLLHTDNPNGTTTKGTPQDTEGRFQKTFWKTRKMITRSIDKLRRIAPVDVLMVPGNHDTQSLWHLGDSLECWYHQVADVSIDNSPRQRKYYQFGKVLLGFTHGDKGKQKDYPLLMATEEAKKFGETIHREMHTGHIHQLQVREQHGVRVRVSPALCAADAWHAENTYVGNARAAEAFVWHAEEGLISQATWTVKEEV